MSSQSSGKRKDRCEDEVPALVPLASVPQSVTASTGLRLASVQAPVQASVSSASVELSDRDRKDILETKVAVGAVRQELGQLRFDIRSIALTQ